MYTQPNGDVDLAPSRVTGWVGWIIFAAVMMIISGIFDVIWGIVGLARDQVFLVGAKGNVVNLDYTTWGWINLIVGIVIFLSGLALLTGSLLASIVAIVLCVLSAVTNLLVISAYPLWSVMVIALNVLVIYAISMHGDELRKN